MTFLPKKHSIFQSNFRMTFLEDQYCTNNLSSLHISNHHCTFCASLHIQTSPVANATLTATTQIAAASAVNYYREQWSRLLSFCNHSHHRHRDSYYHHCYVYYGYCCCCATWKICYAPSLFARICNRRLSR